MISDGQRTATLDGAMLADPATLGNLDGLSTPSGIFEPAFWAARGALQEVRHGRGAAWFVGCEPQQWVLRHYRRGGWVAHISADRYLWSGEERVRSFVEWRLLQTLARRGLPVPVPIAARYRRRGIFYECDLLMGRISGAATLSSTLAAAALKPRNWQDIGATIARFHAVGVDHADLNAHNILLNGAGTVSVIDFDRGRLRAAGKWSSRNVSRLRHSLLKISGEMPMDRFSAADWDFFLAGYSSAPGAPAL